MGTRHLTIVKHEEEIKVAQYGQWDGNPEVTGIDILNFVYNLYSKESILANFKEKLSLCEWADKDSKLRQIEFMRQYSSDPERESLEKQGLISWEESNMLLKLFPESHRDTGSKILHLIHFGYFHKFGLVDGKREQIKYEVQPGKIYLDNAMSFATDRVFCEWAWVIDLDADKLEVYIGQFNHDGSKGIFKDYDDPVRLLTTFDLNDLPTTDGFVEQCQTPDVTDEEALEFIEAMSQKRANQSQNLKKRKKNQTTSQ